MIDYNHIDYLFPLKLAWRCLRSMLMRRKHMHISPLAMFNGGTRLSPHCVVHRGACVGGTSIGRYTFVEQDSFLPDAVIGSFCSIAKGVRIIRYTHPSRGYISTSPSLYSTAGQCGHCLTPRQLYKEQRLADGKSLIVGNDVWIGENVSIIEGTRIGHGAIIGTGAVVTKDVPDYAVVAGVPARILRYRYNPDDIQLLLHLRWWDRDEAWLAGNAALMADDTRFLQEMRKRC